MSAFIVEDATINKVTTWLATAEWIRGRFEAAGVSTHVPEHTGLALFRMNCDAVEQRYGAGQAKEFRDEPAYQFEHTPADPVVVYKAAQCLRYQCSEGSVPERPLFKALSSMIETLADEIIAALPAYDSAPWE